MILGFCLWLYYCFHQVSLSFPSGFGPLQRHGLRPAHEVFPAYLRGQVSRLVTQRLAALPGPVFEPNAVEFCARKVANGSGDMRLALEAAAQAVEILAAETEDAAKKKAEKEAMDKAAAAAGAGDKEPEEKEMGEGDAPSSAAPKAPRVGMRHMAKALSRLTGGIGSSNANVAAIRMLPVPQQLLMCTVGKLLGEKLGAKGMTVRVPSAAPSLASAAAKFIGHAGIPTALVDEGPAPVPGSAADAKQRRASGPGKHELTVADLQEAHQALCKKVGVAGYSGSEFMTAVEVLQTQGLVDIVGPRGDLKRSRVTLRVAEDDVLMALVDVPVLKDVVGA